ncbi:MAG TPA: proline--tRNA ligase [Methylomirabilota bacterium]|nr:proline--tRNA ligase [Methylomirabilota bacterium]
MRASRLLLATLKETPADAEVVSHQLMLRAGMIRKIEQIVREEMNRAGAQELLMPIASQAELWQESGRWEMYGKELVRFKDRHERDFCLGPTHEEVVTDLIRRAVRSYRELPLNLYQIQTKFRDEVRPRFGLMRGREFIMKDAYSFHTDVEDCRREYENMVQTYKRIFTRCGLRFRPVEADTGAIGGSLSHEFQVLAEAGEDAIVSCDRCDYAANAEKAEVRAERPAGRDIAEKPPKLEKVATPGKKTVAQVAAFLKLPADKFIKTLVYRTDSGEFVAALARGDHEINELKLKKILGCNEVHLADESAVAAATGVAPGFLGPIGLQLRMVADLAVQGMREAATGANQPDAHFIHVDQERDFTPSMFGDLRFAAAGDRCPRCEQGKLESYRGIEVGQVFYLGTKYSQSMGATFLDAEGRERPIEMGCYGIGISRLVAAAIEQNHDANGIIWPIAIAPFHVLLLPINYKDQAVRAAADRLYHELQRGGVEVLLDDRDERPGVKFKDADLIGIPWRVTIGARGLEKGAIELRRRQDGKTEEIPLAQGAQKLQAIRSEALEA